jgi:hypothetical protein
LISVGIACVAVRLDRRTAWIIVASTNRRFLFFAPYPFALALRRWRRGLEHEPPWRPIFV